MDLDELTDFFDDANVDQLKGLWEDKDRITDGGAVLARFRLAPA